LKIFENKITNPTKTKNRMFFGFILNLNFLVFITIIGKYKNNCVGNESLEN